MIKLIRNKIVHYKMRYLLLFVLVVSLVGILMISDAFAQDVIPSWVKNTAGWWATDAISETEFVNAIEFLIKENIIQVNVSQTSETSQGVPDWVKNTAGWWATDVISETEFVNAIAYLVKVGIISIESSKSPELIAEMWVNGHINDDEFLESVEQLIEKEIITIQSDSTTNMSDLPDWLVNNAGWWAAKIFTNSDFDFEPGYVKEELYPCNEFSQESSCFKKTYNSYGFRGNEFEKEKPEYNLHDAFTQGQLRSKLWLLKHLRGIDLGIVFICAGWYGTLARAMFENERIHFNKIRSFDIDPKCAEVADMINKQWNIDDFKFKASTVDIHSFEWSDSPAPSDGTIGNFYYNTIADNKTVQLKDNPNTFINTSCEHIEKFTDWFNLLPAGKLVALQSNDYFDLPEHVNCVKDINQFKQQAPLSNIIYEGELELEKYTRFMLIGYK